jgi:ABC-type polar amino acid transport system ATPase subunit
MLVVTHEMAFARDAANRVIFMEKGNIVEEASSADFFNQPREERTRQFLGRAFPEL